jgi:transcriptional regulator with XRE-family HTH domain/tetratricopeptide (TPR) repeat protein
MSQSQAGPRATAVHFGAFLKTLRHRHGIRQLEVLAHLPGWTQTTYSRVESGEIAPAFDQLAPIYSALRQAGVEWTPPDRQHYLTLARTRIETKKTYQEHRSDQEWDELRLRLSRSEPDGNGHARPASRQPQVASSPRLVETRHLVGREDWLASVMASLHERLPRKLVVLQGPVGIGKSSELHRIALQTLSSDTAHPQVILCELPAGDLGTDAQAALDLLVGTLLVEIGPAEASAQLIALEARIAFAFHCLEKASRPLLLLVDNAEQLLDEQGQLAPCWEEFLKRFLRNQHRATLVLATREWPGWYEGERAFLAERTVPSLTADVGALLLQQLGLATVLLEHLRRASEAVGGVPLCLEWVASLVQEPMWLDRWEENDDLDGQSEGDQLTLRLQRLLEDASLFGGPIAAKLHPLLERLIDQRLSADAYQVLCHLALAAVPLGKPALQVICPRPRLLKELSATSLLAAYPQRVQLLPMVASAVRARLTEQQTHALETDLMRAYKTWKHKGELVGPEAARVITELITLLLKHHRLLEAAQQLLIYHPLIANFGHGRRLARVAGEVMNGFDWRATPHTACGGLLLHYTLAPFLGKAIDERARAAAYQGIVEAASSGAIRLKVSVEGYLLGFVMECAINTSPLKESQLALEAWYVRLSSLQPAQTNSAAQTYLLEARAWVLGIWSDALDEEGEPSSAQRLREQAINLYRHCLALLSGNIDQQDAPPLRANLSKSRLSSCYSELAYYLGRCGQLDEALQMAERGIALKEEGHLRFGTLASAYGEKADILAQVGRFQEALSCDDQSLAEAQRLADLGHAPSQEELWFCRARRGRLLLLLGSIDEAEPLLREALPHLQQTRRRRAASLTQSALDAIEQWHRQATISPRYQLDWRWVERYRELAAYDSYWWLTWAGPFSEEEQRQWERLFTPPMDESTREQLGVLLMQSRERELEASLAEERDPHLRYPAIEIEEVRRRITALQTLMAEIRQSEPNAIVRRLYQETIGEEVDFLRLIEATSEGDTAQFWACNLSLFPAPTAEEMHAALARVTCTLQQGCSRPEIAEVSQQLDEFLRTQLHLSLSDLVCSDERQAEQEEQQAEEQPSSAHLRRMVSAQAARRFFAAVLQECGFEGWQVVIDSNAANARVEQGLRRFYLPEQRFALEKIRHLIAHELLGHVAQCAAGERSPLGLLGIHLKNSQPTEEGLALYHERHMAALYGQPFNESGMYNGMLATGLACGVVTPPQTFRSLFTFFERYSLLGRLLRRPDANRQKARKQARTYALSTCLRTFRGVPDLQRAGVCYLQDTVHLHGLRLIEQAIKEDESVLDRLAVGVCAIEHLPDLQELGILSAPQPLRKLADDPHLDAYILSFEESEENEKHA